MKRILSVFFLALAAVSINAQTEIKVGIIGTDTSHVPAFTKLLNDKNDPGYIPGARVVAAFKGGSPDVESSHTRVDKYAEEISTKYGVEIVDSIEKLLAKVIPNEYYWYPVTLYLCILLFKTDFKTIS